MTTIHRKAHDPAVGITVTAPKPATAPAPLPAQPANAGWSARAPAARRPASTDVLANNSLSPTRGRQQPLPRPSAALNAALLKNPASNPYTPANVAQTMAASREATRIETLSNGGPVPPNRKQYNPATARGMADLAVRAYENLDTMATNLTESGFKDVKVISDPNSSTEVFVATRDDAIVVGFRGSQEGTDWIRDGRSAMKDSPEFGGKVHEGFLEGYQAVAPQVMAAIREAQANGAKPVMFTGHSLGGALAQLGAADARRNGIDVAALYTFGSPKVGNEDWVAANRASGLADVTFRVVNHNDIVPRVPNLDSGAAIEAASALDTDKSIGARIGHLKEAAQRGVGNLTGENRYEHSGNTVYFDQHGTRSMNPSLGQRVNARISGNPATLGIGGTGTDHMMAGYVAQLERNIIR